MHHCTLASVHTKLIIVKLLETELRFLVLLSALPATEPLLSVSFFIIPKHTFESMTSVSILIDYTDLKVVFYFCVYLGILCECMFVYHVPTWCPRG